MKENKMEEIINLGYLKSYSLLSSVKVGQDVIIFRKGCTQRFLWTYIYHIEYNVSPSVRSVIVSFCENNLNKERVLTIWFF